MLHHSKCCILHADSKNEPWDHLRFLQMQKALKGDFHSRNPRFPNLPHGILECARGTFDAASDVDHFVKVACIASPQIVLDTRPARASGGLHKNISVRVKGDAIKRVIVKFRKGGCIDF